jgi:hypothetical protein
MSFQTNSFRRESPQSVARNIGFGTAQKYTTVNDLQQFYIKPATRKGSQGEASHWF